MLEVTPGSIQLQPPYRGMKQLATSLPYLNVSSSQLSKQCNVANPSEIMQMSKGINNEIAELNLVVSEGKN
jgi:hypothetical protein